jgi:hypothetical protein
MRREAFLIGWLACILALAAAQAPRIEFLTDQELNDTTGTAQDVSVVGLRFVQSARDEGHSGLD